MQCAGRTNVRTIEGDCNNLFSRQLGAVGHPLKRLPKNDPNPFNGQPGGLLDISPRKVSNVFFAQSEWQGNHPEFCKELETFIVNI